jgi:predicted RNase H-like nuclease (RuvC/YqgF family)
MTRVNRKKYRDNSCSTYKGPVDGGGPCSKCGWSFYAHAKEEEGMNTRCTTHHACDCLIEKIERLEAEVDRLKFIHEQYLVVLSKPEKYCAEMISENTQLKAELKELKLNLQRSQEKKNKTIAELEAELKFCYEALSYYDRNDSPNDGVVARKALSSPLLKKIMEEK